MQAKRMKRKGLTLLEVIISIAVYAVLALLLAEIMTLVNSTIRSTEQLNNRLSYEAKYADNLMTSDDAGEFSSDDVGVTIQYEVTDKDFEDKDDGTRQVTKVISNKIIRKSAIGKDLKAEEYTANYDEPSAGTHYHDNTNYRFMRFEKSRIDQSIPADFFTLRIWFAIPESVKNDIRGILAEGNFDDGTNSKEISLEDFRMDTNGWYYVDRQMSNIDSKEPDPENPEEFIGRNLSVTNTIKVTIYRKTTTAKTDSHTINLNPDQVYDKFTLEYPLSQNQGSATNYYKGYNIIYVDGGVKTPSDLTDEERNDHGIPKEMELNFSEH